MKKLCILGGVSINFIYYTMFSKVLCFFFCQIPSPYQDSHTKIICENPECLRHDIFLLHCKDH